MHCPAGRVTNGQWPEGIAMDVETLLDALKAAESRVRELSGAIRSIRHDAGELRLCLDRDDPNLDMAQTRLKNINRAIARAYPEAS